MTRNRATSGTTGRVVLVGGGPGDPGMLTARATAALAEAAVVLVDPDVSVAVQDAVREANPQAELTTAEGEPAEVAKAAVAAAKSGSVVVRLVAGDPYTSDAVVKEVLAVGRTSVPFDVVPGVATATAVPAFAGVAVGSTAVTADLRSGVDLSALAGAVTGGTLVLQGDAEELPDAAAGALQPASSAASVARSAVTQARTVTSSNRPSSSRVRASLVRHSTASAPCAGAGSTCSGSSVSVIASSRPSRARPARASTTASRSPSATRRMRVSTLPRIGTTSTPRPSARSCATRRGAPVPIFEPGGSSPRVRPSRATSASRGSCRAGTAAMISPGSAAVGRSL